MMETIKAGQRTLFTTTLLFLLAGSALGQEWYIPKRPEVIEPRRLEVGFRTQFVTNDDGLLESQELSFIPSVRASPFDRFELYGELPYSFVERDRIVGFDLETNRGDGIGDLFTQLTYQLFRGDDWAVLPSLDLLFWTGRNPYEHTIGTGGGHTRYAPGVTAVKIIDPVVLFAYVGYQISERRRFEMTDDETTKVEPGDSFRLRIGGSFYLNPKIRVSLFTATDIQGKTKLDGENVRGTGGNAVRFGSGLDWTVTQRVSTNFNAVFGTSDRTPDAVLAVGVTYRFR